jgi:hypothetical protein
MAPPVLSGKANGRSPASAFTAVTTGTLTTTSGTQLIIVVDTSHGGATSVTVAGVTSVTGSALTFTKRGPTFSFGASSNTERWWAPATASFTGAIRVTWSTSQTTNAVVSAFGVAGVNSTSSPWDTNPGLPYHNSSASAIQPIVTGITTSQNNDLLLAVEGGVGNTLGGTPTGYTLIAGITANLSPSGLYEQSDAFEAVTSAQAGASCVFSGAPSNWVMVVDAVTADAPAAVAIMSTIWM